MARSYPNYPLGYHRFRNWANKFLLHKEYIVYDGACNCPIAKYVGSSIKNKNARVDIFTQTIVVTKANGAKVYRTPEWAVEFINRLDIEALHHGGLTNYSIHRNTFRRILKEIPPQLYNRKR